MDNQRIKVGDIVQHFKRELCDKSTKEYLYQVKDFAQHTETGEQMVVYKALYPPFTTYVRPYDMFMSEVDKTKYPNIKQKYRFEVVADYTDKTDHCTPYPWNGGQV